jgi:hypothetical protein
MSRFATLHILKQYIMQKNVNIESQLLCFSELKTACIVGSWNSCGDIVLSK